MPFSMTVEQAAKLDDTVPGIRAVRDLPMPQGRGLLLNNMIQAAYRTRHLAGLRGILTLLEFSWRAK